MLVSEQVKALIRSFQGYKGAFTRLRKSNDRLVEYAPTVPTPTTAEALQKALERLEGQYERLCTSMDRILQACDDAKIMEDLDLDTYAEQLLDYYEGNRANILDAINTIGTPAREALYLSLIHI